ncbi:MAG TPA: hypothetical protein PKA06_01430 [Gemmatales bacterium]|mgnify:CR=1 FL=1|nr:hypothetical protein [Gemmatales bacterium]HMP18594.1 hypothetical protein [Gemmatales bacterium]
MRANVTCSWSFCGILLVTGCSTSPCADFLDHFFPAKPAASGPGAYGGVCDPQPAAPGVAGGPVAPSTAMPNVISGPPAVPSLGIPAPGPGASPLTSPPPTQPVAPPPGSAPYIPGGTGAFNNLPAPDLSGIPISTPPQPGGTEAKPLPSAPPPGNPPPF